jgi:hypothetical protein
MKMNQGNSRENRVQIDIKLLEACNLYTIEESQTIIHCKIKAFAMFQQGGWANISPNTYLLNRQSNERLKLIHAENIPYAPHRHFFGHPKDVLYFTLLFQKIPDSWTTFCLYEETIMGDGFFVGEVPKNKNGIYRIRIN